MKIRPFLASTFLGGVVLSAVISVPSAEADKARVLKATANVGGSYTFLVTVAHADSGWKHYADKCEVLAADGTVLETRILYHPHVDEQPFTCGLGNVQIPAEIAQVIVRASDRDGTSCCLTQRSLQCRSGVWPDAVLTLYMPTYTRAS